MAKGEVPDQTPPAGKLHPISTCRARRYSFECFNYVSES